jgi:tripartite-type tricarboxylate transporter receptor subunit TctC
MQPALRYDPIKDFAPITTLANAPVVIIVAATAPPRTLRELIDLAKAQPGALKFGSAGTGHFVHVAGEMFKDAARVDLLHVPYKGIGPALIDLLADRIDVMFDAFAAYEPHLQSGKLRALAVANPSRLARLPDVPTTAEAGLPGYALASWFGLAAPAGTPAQAIERVNDQALKAIAAPDVREQMGKLGLEPGGSTPQQYATMIGEELARWRAVVKAAGIRLE